ncbi:uncharacterized protein LOC127983607 isoform X1 [Carassius gibelio]|uniref:uncharacterized protein LOC127983607 isoform X1 n=1 Tax=Carassius gibelio TaxID=101364 RepID=UPI002277D7B1|nr:uncharacterized protein LOC127983607 isoform X1 [Carassius gibelio]
MALFRGLFEWVQCFVHRIPRRRKKQGVQKCTEAECTPMEGMSRPPDVGNTDQKYQSRYCKASKNLNDKDKREVGRKRKLKKERKMVDERESGRMEEETKDPTPLRIEVKPQPTPPAAEDKTPASSSFLKSVKGPLVAKRTCRHLLPLATKTRPPSSGEEPTLIQKVSQQHPALPAIEVNPLPGSSFIQSSVEEPPLPVANSAPKATETKPQRGSFVVDPEVVQKASRQLAQPATESLAVPTPKPVMSMSPEEEPQMVQGASQHLTEPLVLQHTTAGVKQKPMFVKVHPIVLDQSDDFRKKKCGDSKADASRKSKELDELMMRLFCVDFSNAPKKESQQHLKLENQPALEAGVKQKAVFEKVHPIVLDQSGDSGKKKCADSKDDDLQKAKELDEQMMKLLYVDYSPCPKK